MIPVFRPSCSDLEIRYVTEVLKSGWWDQGPKVEELEEKFAKRIGTRYAVAMNSCTMALQLTIQALGIYRDITMPALTFPSTGLAAIHNGLDISFADIDKNTLCINLEYASIYPSGRAVIPVWYGGTVVPFPLEYSGPVVIEDCAHAAGNPLAGQQGIAACWSFQTKKNIASGDGGMVTTNDKNLAERLRRLRWCGIDRSTWERDKAGYRWEYDIPEAGWKANMNDITAALALAQLERLDEMNQARKDIASWYLHEFADLDWLRLPQWDEYSSWHLFPVRVDDRNEFIDHLQSRGVSAGVHYKPLNQYKIFGEAKLPVTDRVWKTLVTLPLYPDMTEDEAEQVIQAVRSFR